MNKETRGNNKLDETQLFPKQCVQLHPLPFLAPGLLMYIDERGLQVIVGEENNMLTPKQQEMFDGIRDLVQVVQIISKQSLKHLNEAVGMLNVLENMDIPGIEQEEIRACANHVSEAIQLLERL